MKLYTAVNCNPCKVVKNYIEQNELEGIEIKSLTLEEFKSDEIQTLGIRSVPFLVNGSDKITNSGNIIEYLKNNL